MEFREYGNPLENGYDIKSGIAADDNGTKSSVREESANEKRLNEILEVLGFLQDEDLEKIGITEEEYLNPSAETIAKLSSYVDSLKRR